MDYFKIGQNIRGYRKAAGLSQEQLAEKVWISVTHMSHIETGQTKLSLPVLVDLANALAVTPNQLLDGQYTAAPSVQEGVFDLLSDCSQAQQDILREILLAAKHALLRHK